MVTPPVTKFEVKGGLVMVMELMVLVHKTALFPAL